MDLALLHVEDEIRDGRVVPLLEGWTRAPRYMCLRTVDNFTWLRDAYRRFAEARAAGLV